MDVSTTNSQKSDAVYRTGPLVSIVIPCFNQGSFLGEALASATQQSYATIEIIVIDDGSTEDIASIVKSYPGVSYIRQRNQGLSAARNAGMRVCRGEYVVFLDADDRLLPEAIDAGLNCFKKHPAAAFVSGGYHHIDVNGQFLTAPYPAEINDDHYNALLRCNYVGMHAAVMYRRDRLLSVGGFDVHLDACEDYDVYLMLSRQFPVACHDKVIAEYRFNPAGMSRDLGRMLHNLATVRRKQKPFINESPARYEASRVGRAYWNDLYARPLMHEILAEIDRKEFRQAGSSAWKWARYSRCYQLPVFVKEIIKRLLPESIHRSLCRVANKQYYPKPGKVHFGDLRRVTPLSSQFGFDRGKPIDRYYIEMFLKQHQSDIHGRVLEIGDAYYTHTFGGTRVQHSDVLHVSGSNPLATLVGDLSSGEHLPNDEFDCAIITQTLHLIFDHREAIRTLHRMLRPGGVLLLTVPGISQLSSDEWSSSWYWSFTPISVHRLLAEQFGSGCAVSSFGNVLAATAFLQGIASEELAEPELSALDARYPCLIAARAVKCS